MTTTTENTAAWTPEQMAANATASTHPGPATIPIEGDSRTKPDIHPIPAARVPIAEAGGELTGDFFD